MDRKFGILIGLLLLLSPALLADDGWENRILSLTWENDAVDGTDKHYTQGAKILFLSRDDSLPHWLQRFSSTLPALGYETQAQKFGLGVAQEIYTPSDLRDSNILINDRPYAGWLYASFILQRRGPGPLKMLARETLRLEAGVIGPESQAEETQKEWHSVAPQGWSHQLRTEIGLNLFYRREYLARFTDSNNHWTADFIPHVGAAVGNVADYFSLGTSIRLGYNIPNEFSPGSTVGPRWGVYAFSGVDGRAVLRNIFLDGNSFVPSHHVNRDLLTADFVSGVTLVFKRLEVTVSHTIRSREFVGQKAIDSFASANLTIKF